MSELKIRPLDDRVVVLPLEAEEKTPGGILLPDTAREKPQRGKVVAVGFGRNLNLSAKVSSAQKASSRSSRQRFSPSPEGVRYDVGVARRCGASIPAEVVRESWAQNDFRQPSGFL